MKEMYDFKRCIARGTLVGAGEGGILGDNVVPVFICSVGVAVVPVVWTGRPAAVDH